MKALYTYYDVFVVYTDISQHSSWEIGAYGKCSSCGKHGVSREQAWDYIKDCERHADANENVRLVHIDVTKITRYDLNTTGSKRVWKKEY